MMAAIFARIDALLALDAERARRRMEERIRWWEELKQEQLS